MPLPDAARLQKLLAAKQAQLLQSKAAPVVGVIVATLILAMIIVITIVYWPTETHNGRIGVGVVVLILNVIQFGIQFYYLYKRQVEISNLKSLESELTEGMDVLKAVTPNHDSILSAVTQAKAVAKKAEEGHDAAMKNLLSAKSVEDRVAKAKALIDAKALLESAASELTKTKNPVGVAEVKKSPVVEEHKPNMDLEFPM